MPDDEKLPLTEKPAEMSFSDWKKMKNALNSSAENKLSNNSKEKETMRKNGKKSQSAKPPNSYNNSRQNNAGNNRGNNDYRQQQSLQYFGNLKQNNLRIFNNAGDMRNTEFLGQQMLMMQALNSIARSNQNMGSYNNKIGAFNYSIGPSNNNRYMGSFNHNMTPFNNNMVPFNPNMGSFNNNMNMFKSNIATFNNNNSMRPMPPMQQRLPPSMAQSSFRPEKRNTHNNRGFTDNYMGKNDDFECMSEVPIPQQPYKSTNKLPSLMLLRTQKRHTSENKKNSANKSNGPKPNEANVTNNQTAATTQKKPKPTKQKREWIPLKPPMPPPIIALTPEAQEAKQRMWREYRQKIKPFKNKDFLNAKRVIQRLKKKPFEELDEKEKERWEKANEFVNSHKKMLTERAMARGEAASVRAARVQDALNSEKNNTRSSASVQVSAPLNNYVPASNNDNEHYGHGENSNDLPSPSEAAGTSNITENWELWNSFVPGGVLFKS